MEVIVLLHCHELADPSVRLLFMSDMLLTRYPGSLPLRGPTAHSEGHKIHNC